MNLRNSKTVPETVKNNQSVLCDKCGEEFNTGYHLNKHVVMDHYDEKGLICEDCFVCFTTDDSYKKHLDLHGTRCSICKKSFHCLKDLKSHENTHKLKYKCPHCALQTFRENVLIKHMKSHAKAAIRREKLQKEKEMKKPVLRQYKCNYCNKRVISKTLDDHNKHLKDFHKDESNKWFCKVCDMTFENNSGFVGHLKKHKKYSVFCKHCGNGFQTKTCLLDHMWVHTGEKRHKCPDCDTTCSTKGSLTVHLRIHTGELPYQCDICQYSFTSKSSLNKHMPIHTDMKPFKCYKCAKCFRTTGGLKKHTVRHERPCYRPHACQFCPKTFANGRYRDEHEKIHLGERGEPGFTCEICSRSFYQKTALKRHQYVHTDMKPFKCTQCELAFKSEGDLKIHIKRHSDSGPYECSICFKGYYQKVQVENHVKSHFRKDSCQCHLCSKMFCNKNALKNHTNEHIRRIRIMKFACSLCGMGCKSLTALKKHSKSEHQEC